MTPHHCAAIHQKGRACWSAMQTYTPSAPDLCFRRAVAFRIYDLDRTGDIQPSEVARLLGALLLNNPDMALDDASIQKIVDQARPLELKALLLCATRFPHLKPVAWPGKECLEECAAITMAIRLVT